MAKATPREMRRRRHLRVRKKISGTPQRPRLAVFRSSQHIYAQVIDDTIGHTLAAASDLESAVRAQLSNGATKTDAARLVGRLVAERTRARGIETVVFDRGGFLY
ncbi:MAG: 50S ribosomal protein L18, partial [Chloroflexota bacterium]